MNLLDYASLAIVLFYAFTGIRKGFVRIIFDLIAMVGGLYLAVQYTDLMGDYLVSVVNVPEQYSSVVGFAVIWGGVLISVMVIGMVIHRLFGWAMLGPINAVGGGVLGVLKGVVVLIPFWFVLMVFDAPWYTNSRLIRPVSPIVNYIATHYLPNLTILNQAAFGVSTPDFHEQPGEFSVHNMGMADDLESEVTSSQQLKKIALDELQEALKSGNKRKLKQLLTDD